MGMPGNAGDAGGAGSAGGATGVYGYSACRVYTTYTYKHTYIPAPHVCFLLVPNTRRVSGKNLTQTNVRTEPGGAGMLQAGHRRRRRPPRGPPSLLLALLACLPGPPACVPPAPGAPAAAEALSHGMQRLLEGVPLDLSAHAAGSPEQPRQLRRWGPVRGLSATSAGATGAGDRSWEAACLPACLSACRPACERCSCSDPSAPTSAPQEAPRAGRCTTCADLGPSRCTDTPCLLGVRHCVALADLAPTDCWDLRVLRDLSWCRSLQVFTLLLQRPAPRGRPGRVLRAAHTGAAKPPAAAAVPPPPPGPAPVSAPRAPLSVCGSPQVAALPGLAGCTSLASLQLP
jgi:hypothetical protein